MIDLNDLKPCDILLTSDDGIISTTIKASTKSNYSHSLIYLGNGEIIEADKSGIAIKPLVEAIKGSVKYSILRVAGLTNEDCEKMVAEAPNFVGKKYAFFDAAKSIDDITCSHKIENGFFCSEFTLKLFEASGIILANRPASCITPGLMENLQSLEKVIIRSAETKNFLFSNDLPKQTNMFMKDIILSTNGFSLDLIKYAQEHGVMFKELQMFKTDTDLNNPQIPFCEMINRFDKAQNKASKQVQYPESSMDEDESSISTDAISFLERNAKLITGEGISLLHRFVVSTPFVKLGTILLSQVQNELRDKSSEFLQKEDVKSDFVKENLGNILTETKILTVTTKEGFANVIAQNETTQKLVKEGNKKIDAAKAEIENKIEQKASEIKAEINIGVETITTQASKNTQTILTGLDKVGAKVDTNIQISLATYDITTNISGEVNSIGKYLFLQMPLSMQDQILQGTNINGTQQYELNFVKNLSPETRSELQLKVSQLKEKQELQEGLQKVLGVANTAVGLLNAMGAPPALTKFLGNTVSLGGNITEMVFSSFVPPNPYGIVTGVIKVISSIFGFFSDDEDATQKALQQIQESIQRMHNDMIKGFNQLQELAINNQKQLLQYMEFQTQLMQNGFDQLTNRLVRIEKKQDDLLFLTISLLNVNKGLFKKSSQDLNNTQFARFEDYAVFCEDFPEFPQILPEIKKQIAIDDGESQVIFDYVTAKSKRYIETNDWVDFEYNNIYQPTLDLFNFFFKPTVAEGNQPINALFFPVKLVTDNLTLLWEINETQQTNHNETKRLLEKDYYYNPESILFFSDLYLKCCIFFDIKGRGESYIPYRTLNEYLEAIRSRPEMISIRNKERIKETTILLYYTNRALVQQTLLSGLLLLQPLYYTLRHQTADVQTFKKIKELFQNNYLIATNFAVLLISELIDINQPNISKFAAFSDAYNNKDLNALNSLTDNEIEFILRNDQVAFNFRSLTLTCPSPAQVESREMIYAASVTELLRNKQRLEEKLIDLNFGTALSNITQN